MAAVSGIWNHAMATNPLTQPKAMSDQSSTNDSSATIGANDFLTLLVTEMKNQDPTANTDPNEYVNQLVQVNSLEQLISINQNLSTALGISDTDAEVRTTLEPHSADAEAAAGRTGPANVAETSNAIRLPTPGAQISSGNLSVPATNPAALRVAQASSGRN